MGGLIKKYDILGIFKNDPTGTTLIIQGKKRAGKSHLVAIFVRLLLGMGFSIITNFQFTDQVFKRYEGRLFYITGAKEMLKAYTKIAGNGILLLDDFQAIKGSKSTQVQGEAGDRMADFSIFSGKMRLSLILIQHLDYTPKAITNQDPKYIYKLNKPFFYWSGSKWYPGNDKARIINKCKKIPVPDIKPLDYAHEDIGFFIFDVDFKDLWDFMARNRGKGNKKIIAEYLLLDNEKRDLERLRAMTWDDIAGAIAIKRPKINGKTQLYKIIPHNCLYPALEKYKHDDKK